jgi:hypothetical protein
VLKVDESVEVVMKSSVHGSGQQRYIIKVMEELVMAVEALYQK